METLDKATEPKKPVTSNKYKVTVDCYWNETLWHMDDVAELPAGVTPPKEYFSKI